MPIPIIIYLDHSSPYINISSSSSQFFHLQKDEEPNWSSPGNICSSLGYVHRSISMNTVSVVVRSTLILIPHSYSGRFPPGGCKISLHKKYISTAFPSQTASRDKPTVQNSANRLKNPCIQPKLCLFYLISAQKHQMNTKKSFKHCINT